MSEIATRIKNATEFNLPRGQTQIRHLHPTPVAIRVSVGASVGIGFSANVGECVGASVGSGVRRDVEP